ncbi:MAG: hypothetical protein ACM3SQ_16880 [Betaproteobacteria bacterium]
MRRGEELHGGAAILGLAMMIASEAATLAGVKVFAQWNTPICWTGFILFADGLVRRRRGSSWLTSAPREFVGLALASIGLWLVFEFYNLFLHNWHYVGLPARRAVRLFGYAWAFATIWPAIFEAAELIGVWRGPASPARAARPARPAFAAVSMAAGAAMLVSPLVVSPAVAHYLAAPVWLGFIFLLDPINARLGAESLTGDFARGRHDRFWNLILAGFLCGGLWEFWNYWSIAKWHYTVPIMADVRIFEMPVPGYFGFPPFALECFTMYVFVRAVAVRLAGAAGSGRAGRTIGL